MEIWNMFALLKTEKKDVKTFPFLKRIHLLPDHIDDCRIKFPSNILILKREWQKVWFRNKF